MKPKPSPQLHTTPLPSIFLDKTVIYHVDVNSAFLSWEAADRLARGEGTDLRTIPSAIGGSESQRHGIVLAKSTPAKKYHIQTGEPLIRAREKCPELLVVPPNFTLYAEKSKAFISLLSRYAPKVEQFSIDEAYCDMSGTGKLFGHPVTFAEKLKATIADELGFTVNIGISTNRLLAKMASDFEKPDKVHTLFPEEIPVKLWPLPIENLLYVGKSTAGKLHRLGIHTIYDLAHTDPEILRAHFKKHGQTIYDYANGRDLEQSSHDEPNKGYGNSITVSFDVTDAETAKRILLSLTETVSARIRADHAFIRTVSVNLVYDDFEHCSKQCTLESTTNVTEKIYEAVSVLFDRLWSKKPIRLLGVQTSKATSEAYEQMELFGSEANEKYVKLNSAIDDIRSKFGEDAVMRACFMESKNAENYQLYKKRHSTRHPSE